MLYLSWVNGAGYRGQDTITVIWQNGTPCKIPFLIFYQNYVTLTTEEKEAIVSVDVFRSFKKGTVLLKEGQISTDTYFVLKGCIRTYYVIDGKEKTTAFYTEMEA